MTYVRYLRILAFALFFLPLEAQTQIGGGACANSTLNGTFFYLQGGTLIDAGQAVAAEELGKLVTDGAGGVTGQSTTSVNGSIATHTITGTYVVQANCTGTFTLAVDSQPPGTVTLQIVDNGQEMLLAGSTSEGVIVGRAYSRADSTGSGQCAAGSLSGTYGYLLTGVTTVSGSSFTFAESGTVTSDGDGNLSVVAVVNSSASGQGTYSISSDCSGTAQISNSNGTANYAVAVVEGGQTLLFMEADAGTTIGGTAVPQFSAPQQAIVNGASFAPRMLAPGSLFSIFGSGFAQQASSAQQLPLPQSLDSVQVLVNGSAVPLLYAGPNQVNAQLPLDVPIGQLLSLAVASGMARSNTVTISVSAAAPGLFTYGQGQAVVQNPDGSINSSAQPAHPGDILVAYLTGGGLTETTDPLITGTPASGPSSVSSPYSVAVGGQPATGYYLGLTPGYVGLYQANFRVPALAPGNYPLAVTVDGATSNSAIVSVAN